MEALLSSPLGVLVLARSMIEVGGTPPNAPFADRLGVYSALEVLYQLWSRWQNTLLSMTRLCRALLSGHSSRATCTPVRIATSLNRNHDPSYSHGLHRTPPVLPPLCMVALNPHGASMRDKEHGAE
jgi:hypothetical protein